MQHPDFYHGEGIFLQLLSAWWSGSALFFQGRCLALAFICDEHASLPLLSPVLCLLASARLLQGAEIMPLPPLQSLQNISEHQTQFSLSMPATNKAFLRKAVTAFAVLGTEAFPVTHRSTTLHTGSYILFFRPSSFNQCESYGPSPLHPFSCLNVLLKSIPAFVLNSNLLCAMMIMLTLCISQQTRVLPDSSSILGKWGVPHN